MWRLIFIFIYCQSIPNTVRGSITSWGLSFDLVSVTVILFVGLSSDVDTKPVLAYLMFRTIGDILPQDFDSSVR